MPYTIVPPQQTASRYQLVPPPPPSSDGQATPPAPASAPGKYRLEAPGGLPVNPYDLGSGGEDRVAQIVGGLGKAIGQDVKEQIIDPVIQAVKTPGEVARGDYGTMDDPRFQSAARQEALMLAGSEAPLVRRGSVTAKPAEGIGAKPPEAAVEAPKPAPSESAPAASAPPQPYTIEPPPGATAATSPTRAPTLPTPAETAAAPPEGTALAQPPAIAKPRALEDQLFQLRNLETADRLDALDAVRKLPEDYTPEIDEKLYHHEEGFVPGETADRVPLTERETEIYNEHVKPIREEADALSKDLSRLTGITPDINEVYTPRYVAGRTRSYGESIAQWMKGIEARFGGAASRTMRKTVDAQKGRDFFMAENSDTGDRTLVYVAPDRKVYSFDGSPEIKQFGTLAGSTGPKTGAIVRQARRLSIDNNRSFRLTQATTKEIEAQAQTRYVKSVMANRLDNLAKLRSAVRNAKFIDDMKALPEFGDYFKPANETPIPPVTGGRQWRRPSLPQFQQYLTDPRIADAFDDFARSSKDAEGLNRALNAIGRAMNAVMFMNPKAHIDNVFNHMLVGRGLYGNVAHAPSVVRNLVRGAREVWTLGPEYRNALKSGLSLPYARLVAGDLHPTLLKRLGTQITQNPAVWNRIAGQMGYPSAKMMLQRWLSVPNRILWSAQDAMMMSRVLELKERGIPIEKAIRTAEEEIPNYRVPGQVLGSRGLAELFGNPAFGRFGRYQFGRMRAYVDSVKQAFSATGGLFSPERLHAFDQMIMLGVYTFGVYSLYDWMWQQATGNPLASTVRSGASAIPKAIEDVYEGKKKAGDLIYSLFTLGVPIELASELYEGRYGWSGQPIIRDADVRKALSDPVRAKQVGRDIASYFAQMFSSIGTLVSPSSQETKGQIGLRALGIISPTEQQMQRRQRAQSLDERAAKRRAYRQEYAP